MDADNACPLGLGYFHSSHSSSHHDQDNNSNNMTTPDALIQQYMQQCLEFHGQQEELRQQQEQAQQQQQHPPAEEQEQPASTVRFVHAQHPAVLVVDESTATVSLEMDQKWLEQGKLRAQAILERFQRQQQTLLLGNQNSSNDTTSTIISDHAAPSSSLYALQRQRGLRREAVRKRLALVKNLEYVSRRETQKLQQLAVQINESRQLQAIAHDSYQAALKERTKLLKGKGGPHNLNSQAAIGTSSRKRVELEKKRVFTSSGRDDDSVAIYLSGLPTNDGSVDEHYVRQLFSSYARIRKVHLYRNKNTTTEQGPLGQLKGDGLVIYQVDCSDANKETKQEAADRLVETVCSQMNGAELPCGNILRVEPADSSYNRSNSNQSHQRQHDYYGATNTRTKSIADNDKSQEKQGSDDDMDEKVNHQDSMEEDKMAKNHVGAIEKSADESDDLDDFFSSL